METQTIIKNKDELTAFAENYVFSVLSTQGGNQTQGDITQHTAGEKSEAVVVGLSGELGSGKTTFSQMVAVLLGVTDIVTSPTFVIEKVYKTTNTIFSTFIHIDAYRLENAEELNSLGFAEECKKPHTLIFIEWSEKVQSILPPHTHHIHFKYINEDTRHITY